jgi:gliding motility-associated-like protein
VIDLDSNVDFNNPNSITLITGSQQGATIVVDIGKLIVDYNPIPDFIGKDKITIKVCDDLNRCTTEEVTIEVGGKLIVYNAVSPNGDNLNESLYLKYIDPTNNNVTIFNRWGDLVFEINDYRNKEAGRRFEGFDNSGNELPNGTYFYKIKYSGGVYNTGYFTLKR